MQPAEPGVVFLFLGILYIKEGFEAFRDTIDLTAYADADGVPEAA